MTELGYDPDRHIYSPEASDTDPRGDWQSRLGKLVVLIVLTLAMMAGAWVMFWRWS